MDIINDILDFSKHNAGKSPLEETPFRLSDIIKSVASVHTLKASEKNILFNATIGNDVVDCRLGDPHKFTQILHNLLSNAIKFTSDGLVQLTIGKGSAAEDGTEAVTITVSDTGIGMTKDHIANVFSAFVQADSSTTRKFGGTGLGLSIVKSITEAMCGEINVDSSPGIGSTFRITLPLPVASDQTAMVSNGAVSKISEMSFAASILVAEDNQTNCLIMEAFLKRVGATATIVENGRDAVEAYKKGTFDLILMDINMPVMDGEQAFREIRSLEKKQGLAQTPIIAVTADAMEHQVRYYLEVGFDAHLSKPITEKALWQSIADNLICDDSVSSSPITRRASNQ